MKYFWPKDYIVTPEEKAARRKEIMKPTFYPDRLEKMKKELATTEPSRIFVCSQGDMFGDWVQPGADVTPDHVHQVLEVCAELEQHRFLMLTKNPRGYGQYEIPGNCWCGTSITGQEADRLRELREFAPPERSFVSLEPYTGGPVNMGIFEFDWIIVGGLTGENAAQPPTGALAQIAVWASNTDNVWLYFKDNAEYPSEVKQFPEGLQVE